MSGWSHIALVARRDFVQRATSRPFLLTMLTLLAVVVVAGPFLASVTEADPEREVGLLGEPSAAFTAAAEAVAEQVGLEPTYLALPDRAAGDEALEQGDVDVLLLLEPAPGTVVWQQTEDLRLATILTAAVQAEAQQEQGRALGLTPEEAARLVAPLPPTTEVVEADDSDDSSRQAASFVGMLLLYVAVILFGQFVMLGVVEEKSSRVVEVILSRVLPYRLLAGKVLGIGALAVVQMVALAVAIYVAARLSGAVEDFSLAPGLVASVLVWFFLGFAFFSVLYAALGATVTRQEDLQSVAFIPIVLVLPGYFIGIIAGNDPDALVVRIASLVPPLSPFVMPIRSAASDVPAWEIALSVVLLLVATYGMIRLAGRIYTGAILSVGRRVSLRDAWRSSTHVPTE